MSGEFQLDFGIDHPEAPTVVTAAVTRVEPGDWPTVVIRVTGIEENEFGARMTADMLRDWADAIEARLPPSNPVSPQEREEEENQRIHLQAQAKIRALHAADPNKPRPTIDSYQTPERVLKNREKRERRRFNPKKAE